MTTKTEEWVCQKCGACCEMLLPHCQNYDGENKLCTDYKNRPWMCVQHKVLGDEFAIDTCVLLRKVRKWGRKVEDKNRLQKVINILTAGYFGASEGQLALLAKQTEENKSEIEASIKRYKESV